jgi:hypothetical protein
MKECSGRALIECLQEGGSADLLYDSVRRHGDLRVVRRWSRVQGRVAVEESASQRYTEGGNRRFVGIGGHKVTLREWVKRQVSLRKDCWQCAATARKRLHAAKLRAGTPQRCCQGPPHWH